ncbi:MAG: glycosyltransferase [Deltaproteobacteria bacterium]|nr:MAG: glycosyltransferase [Deltaproteobacteria bacterium]
MKKAKNDSPLISVITVCLNAAEFIEQAIQSVLSQTYPHLEYIVIDGGSADGTVEIIRKYESRLDYWHSQSDRGLAHAFNLGLSQAHGDWILFLNADDFFINPSVIDQVIPYLRTNETADVVYGQVELVTCEKKPKLVPFSQVLGRPWNWLIFCWKNIIPHQAAFTNINYFKKVGFFDEQHNIALEYEHYLRVGRNLQAVFVPVLISRMRKGGVSNKNIIKILMGFREAQIKNNSMPAIFVWSAFYFQIFRCYGGIFLHAILDPLAGKINLAHRNTGKSLSNIAIEK